MADAEARCVPGIVLGTMRIHEVERSPADWAEFLIAAWELGVTRLHSSSEYESFPLLRLVLRLVREQRPDVHFRHMVKLADPHFDEESVDETRFSARVDSYCEALGAQCLHDVQWMWRSGLDDDGERIARFGAAAPRLRKVREALRASGRIERLFCFPYTPAFAQAAVEEEAIDGLAIYRNLRERDYDLMVERCGAIGKPCIAIRPFAAGQAFGDRGCEPRQLLDRVLDAPAVEAAVLSTSNLDHLRELLIAV